VAEEAIFIERRISHYGAMLKLSLGAEDRATLAQLLEDAKRKLQLTKACHDTEA
jgi:hypothetical protein